VIGDGRCLVAVLAPAYLPRRPTETVLYQLVRANLESFLAYAREHYDGGLPRYVENELRAYLRCGLFSEGFVRCHCDACGHDLLVAFSCKSRTACPSCAGRRMANTAAAIVDRVLPDNVPVRQYVLTLPYELRKLAAFKADVLTAIGRIAVEAIFASYRARAKRHGVEDGQCGAINFVQRCGSSVNLNIHFHLALLDGVFTRDEAAGVLFHPASPPTREDLDAIVKRVEKRVMAWLGRRGYLDERSIAERSNEPPAQTALDACATIAMGRGQVATLPNGEAPEAGADHESAPDKTAVAVDRAGFNLHAGTRVEAGDDMGRERLARYGARPPLALERLRRLPGGRVAFRLKYVTRGRGKFRIMTGLEFMARLASILAPPRYPLTRYAGVLGPRSAWRKDVVPKPRERRAACDGAARGAGRDEVKSSAGQKKGACDPARPRAAAETGAATAPQPHAVPKNGASPLPADPGPRGAANGSSAIVMLAPLVIALAPNVLSVRHWGRLLEGALYAATPRLDWASLLRRSFGVDVLECPKCHGRLRVLSVITEREPVQRILAHLGVPTEAPPLARARDPTDDADDVEPQGQLGLGLA
jgi:hypothetical protein